MKKQDIDKFKFEVAGYGHYKVTYKTYRGDFYRAIIDDMTLIDATKNTPYEDLKIENLEILRDAVKQKGSNWSKNFKRIV